MYQNKKAGVTIFIIVGVMILISIASFIYISAKLTKEDVSEPTHVYTNILSADAFNTYVSNCLRASLENGLDLIGKQGGYIYKDQGGFLKKNNTIDLGGYTFTYTIIRDLKEPELPVYPCLEDSTKRGDCRYRYERDNPPPTFNDSKYGINRLPPLDNADNSIKNQLTYFVKNNTIECINRLEPPNFQIELGNTSAIVSFTDFEVIGKIDTNIVLTFKDSRSIITEYIAKSKIPFKKIYSIINETVELDTTDIEFLVKVHSENGTFLEQDLNIKEFEPAPSVDVTHDMVAHDDLVKFTFPFEQKDYIFRFLRQNRKPFLDWGLDMTPNTPGLDPKFKVLGEFATFHKYDDNGEAISLQRFAHDSYHKDSDVYALRGDKIVFFPPSAHDPDEDSLQFDYEGWHAAEIRPLNTAFIYKVAAGDNGPWEKVTKVTDGEFTDSHTMRYWLIHWKSPPKSHHYWCHQCDSCTARKGIPGPIVEITFEELLNFEDTKKEIRKKLHAKTSKLMLLSDTEKLAIEGELKEDFEIVNTAVGQEFLEMVSNLDSIQLSDLTDLDLDQKRTLLNIDSNKILNFINAHRDNIIAYKDELEDIEADYEISTTNTSRLNTTMNNILAKFEEVEDAIIVLKQELNDKEPLDEVYIDNIFNTLDSEKNKIKFALGLYL